MKKEVNFPVDRREISIYNEEKQAIYKSCEEKSRLFALLQRPRTGEIGESYTIAEYGLGAAHRLRFLYDLNWICES